MKFCSQCGSPVSHRIPDGDNLHRYICDACDTIHYQNPRIITGCLPIHEDKVLLCKRAINPRAGMWTLPAGFLENSETVTQGALRETSEEANANAEIIGLYTVFSLPHISQVYMFFRAQLIDLDYSAGEETLETRLFEEPEIPWDELAFPVITQTLKHYFEDRKADSFPVRSLEIVIEHR
ncbi:MAG: NUDIX hydrolase [Gammaproteobacteria bacterium]|nr:NUDIX hydrolase [Gammaproteobacteria bacterium]